MIKEKVDMMEEEATAALFHKWKLSLLAIIDK